MNVAVGRNIAPASCAWQVSCCRRGWQTAVCRLAWNSRTCRAWSGDANARIIARKSAGADSGAEDLASFRIAAAFRARSPAFRSAFTRGCTSHRFGTTDAHIPKLPSHMKNKLREAYTPIIPTLHERDSGGLGRRDFEGSPRTAPVVPDDYHMSTDGFAVQVGRCGHARQPKPDVVGVELRQNVDSYHPA